MKPALPQIGRYSTLDVLGRGGMGVVYLARHPDLGYELAIKVLLKGRSATPAQRKRFQREIRALKQLKHRGLVEILDVGVHQGAPWFAMRRVVGESLEERLRVRGPLSNEEALELGVQLCGALNAAHAIGILHRDLKPDNVLCAPESRYVLTDFGLTKELSRGGVYSS
ncbi:MAG: serine/threonine protein kinase [Planctomycetes bacterium]|nr:serine/threonine protein kinase [Planctomycetota bacterium]